MTGCLWGLRWRKTEKYGIKCETAREWWKTDRLGMDEWEFFEKIEKKIFLEFGEYSEVLKSKKMQKLGRMRDIWIFENMGFWI